MSIITYKTGRKHAKKEHKKDHKISHVEASSETIETEKRKQNSNQQEEKEVMSRARRNRTQSENRAIADKVTELRMQGLPKNRATAAAFRMFSENELRIKTETIREQPGKTAEQVAIERAAILAADRLRKKRKQQRRRQEQADMLARRLTIQAKKEGRQLTRAERILIDKTREGKR
tara:strand:+ start:29388 stop:29915 length:528 start_codon:yes stop_codon:yes gene_type:complete